jgi:hypothetical protein
LIDCLLRSVFCYQEIEILKWTYPFRHVRELFNGNSLYRLWRREITLSSCVRVATPTGLLSLLYTYNSNFACILHFSDSQGQSLFCCDQSKNLTYNSFHCLELIDCGIGSSKKFSLKFLPFFVVSHQNETKTFICPYNVCNFFISPKISGICRFNWLLFRSLQYSID